MRLFISAIVGMSALLPIEQASAQWVYQNHDSAFGASTTHLALTAGPRGYALGLRCSDNEMVVIYMTPEALDSESAILMSAMRPVLKVRIDDGTVHDLPAQLESTADGELSGMASIEPSHIREVRDARKRVAVAFELLGNVYHETDFGVAGSTAASDKMLAGCATDDG